MVNWVSLLLNHSLTQLMRSLQEESTPPPAETSITSDCFEHYSSFSTWISISSVVTSLNWIIFLLRNAIKLYCHRAVNYQVMDIWWRYKGIICSLNVTAAEWKFKPQLCPQAVTWMEGCHVYTIKSLDLQTMWFYYIMPKI